jgi:F0F1-type ATP synthase assembly protein I
MARDAGQSSHRSRASAAAEAESRRLWRLAALGGSSATEVAAGALLGWGLDAWLGTGPKLVIIGTLVGLLVGTITFVRSAAVASREARREAERVAAHLRETAAAAAEEQDDAPAECDDDEPR